MEGGAVYNKGTRTKFVNLGLVSKLLCSTLIDCTVSQDKIKISEAGDCVLHEKRVYRTHEFGAWRRMMSSLVLIRVEKNIEKKI